MDARPTSAMSLPVESMPRRILWKCWLKVHLSLGLFVGGLFVLVSLTGSFLVFYRAIDEWLNPAQLRAIASDRPSQPLSELLAAVQRVHPELSGPEYLILPVDQHDAVQARFKQTTGTSRVVRYVVTIDSRTGRILSDREWGRYLASFIYELHESLLLEEAGETIVGVVALLLLLSVGSGLYLWWPQPGRFRQAVTFKPGASVIRWHYDLHKLIGTSGTLVLFILAFTGAYLEFPKYVTPIVNLVSPVNEFPQNNELRSTVVPGARPLSVDQAVAVAQEIFPDGTLKFIGLPKGTAGVYRMGMRQPGEVRKTSGESQVWLDQYGGAVLKVRDWREFTAGDTFIAWLFPLHNGEAFGLAGR